MSSPPTTMQPAPVWVVIPVHNRRALTERCLRHLHELGIGRWAQVLVVDDGSTDGTRAAISRLFPTVRIVAGDGHLWWAGAIRLGMQTAIEAGAGCICWLNDDCLPDPGSLELLAHLACSHQAIAGGVCRSPDGQPLIYGGGFIRNAWPIPLAKLPADGGEVCGVDWLHGNLVAIPAAVWQRIGLPEARWMRHNFADVAYTHTARTLGIPVWLAPKATATTEINEGLSYRSWVDPAVGFLAMLRGLWNPRVWWFAPGLAYFLVSRFGGRGFGRLVQLMAKLMAVALLKVLLPNRWLARLSRHQNRRAQSGAARLCPTEPNGRC